MRKHIFNLAGNRATVTQYDPCDPEWVVKFFSEVEENGKRKLIHHKGADYFTDDESDAIGTAQWTLQDWKDKEAK